MIADATVNTESGRWWLPLVEGILAIILGLMFLANPSVTSMTFVLGLGLYWFAVGVVDIIGIFQDRRNWGWKLFTGVLGILTGGLIISGMLWRDNPLGTTFVVGAGFTWMLGITGIVYGTLKLIAAIGGAGWWSGVLGGLVAVLSIMLFMNPLAAVVALPWSLGVVLIAGGILLVVVALRMR